MQVFIQLVTLQSSSCYPYVAQARIAKPASPLSDLSYISFYPFLPLGYPPQKRKSPVKSLATIGGALHSLLGFLFAVSSMQEEIKDLCSISPLDNLHSLLH